ncbi:endosomal transmembrane epsin interactor 1 [Clinocottus analis]|uniref:endosomal transmembrane epsin interactor 1 n=1 Tax=Clinocottus analis TaxID=304258 RepID=UPI0035C1F9F6
MSLPVVLPGSCCAVVGAPQLSEPPHRHRPRGLSASSSRVTGGGSRLLLPGRPLLSLGLLQLLLGGSMVVLCFGALSLSNSPPIRNSCPFWAGSSVILSGIVGLTTWRRPMLLLVNVFVLLSLVCVLLNLAGFILCCQGAQLVSSMTNCQLSEAGDVCYCCLPSSKCPEEELLELHPAPSCGTMRVLLKKVLFALGALNALTTAVCLMAAALRYLQIFTARSPCTDELGAAAQETEDPARLPDPDEFVAPAPPPSYFSTFYSYTPRLARRILGDSVIPLPHIYGARIKGVEVFCPLDPPPPYEVVAGGGAAAASARQETEVALTVNPTPADASVPVLDGSLQMASASPGTKPKILPPPLPPPAPLPPQQQPSPAPTPWRKARIQRSNSDPVLMVVAAKAAPPSSAAPSPQTTDSSTQTSQPTLACGQVTLRRGNNNGRTPRRPRPSSMVDYQSYRHTQQLVRRILEQPAARGLAPEVQELVDSIRGVLRSDQEHMEEAVRCASYIEQVFTDSQVGPGPPSAPQQPAAGLSQTFPRPPRRRRRRPGLLHLQSCGDLSSFTCESVEQRGGHGRAGSGAGSRAGSGAGSERPHSLIGVFRETVL